MSSSPNLRTKKDCCLYSNSHISWAWGSGKWWQGHHRSHDSQKPSPPMHPHLPLSSLPGPEPHEDSLSLPGSKNGFRCRADSLWLPDHSAPALPWFWALQETSGIFHQKETNAASYCFLLLSFNFHAHSAFLYWELKNFQGLHFLSNKDRAPLPSPRLLHLAPADIWRLDFWCESFTPASLCAISQTHCAFSYMST